MLSLLYFECSFATLVLTMYTKSDGRGAKHDWTESATSMGALSYLSLQVYAPFFGANYTTAACPRLGGLATFVHVPPTHLVFSLAPFRAAIKVEKQTLADGAMLNTASLCTEAEKILLAFTKRKHTVGACITQLCKTLKRKNPTQRQVGQGMVRDDSSSDENEEGED